LEQIGGVGAIVRQQSVGKIYRIKVHGISSFSRDTYLFLFL